MAVTSGTGAAGGGGARSPLRFLFLGADMRYLFLSVSLFLGCGSPEPNNRVVRANIEDFVTSHRLMPDQAKRRFSGRLVQIYLPPGTHFHDGATVGYKTGFDGVPPVVQFGCREDFDKPNPDEAILVTGRYVGLTHDGQRRGSGIDWYITMIDCSITRLSVSRP